MILKFILVTLMMALVDVAWAYYMMAVGEKNAAKAGLWSACIVLLSAGVVINYVGNHVLLGAAVLGAFLGTYGAIKVPWLNRK